MINNDFKRLIDVLQTRIDKRRKNTLLIFDTEEDLDNFKKKHNTDGIPNYLLVTTSVIMKTCLVGYRYKNFHFVRKDEIDV